MSHKYFYQVLCEHNKQPTGKDKVIDRTHQSTNDNPKCGDCLTLYLQIENEIILDIGFSGHTCDFCTASASMMCREMIGKHVEFASLTYDAIQHCLYLEQEELFGTLKPMMAFGRFPSRMECALLPWLSLEQILAEVEVA